MINKLWAVNIPPEPDSIQFYPVPSLEIAQELTERLKKEALAKFKINGDVIADSIYFEEWKGTEQEHADYLKWQTNKNPVTRASYRGMALNLYFELYIF